MRVHADVHLRIGTHPRQVDDLLPEGPAQHRGLSGADHPQSEATELHIAATHHDGRAFAQAALLGGRFGDGPQHSTGLFNRGKDVSPQPGHIQQRRTPVAGKQI
ncbi:Uncharacterised protein [Leclercia adecarboxylata]|nr:Uncharacterised protein [Leclercia adecarboxylata]